MMFFSCFLDHKVGIAALRHLDINDPHIANLIPEFGPRLCFIAQLQLWRESETSGPSQKTAAPKYDVSTHSVHN